MDYLSGESIATIAPDIDLKINSLAFSGDDRLLIGTSDSSGTTLLAWNLRNGREEWRNERDNWHGQSAAPTGKGDFLVVRSTELGDWLPLEPRPDGNFGQSRRTTPLLLLCDPATGKTTRRIERPQASGIAAARDRPFVIETIGSPENELRFWNLESDKPYRSIGVRPGEHLAAVTPDGKRYFTTHGSEVLVWKTPEP